MRVSVQGGDGVEQLTAVSDSVDTQLLQVLRRQTRQDRVIDRGLAECPLVLSKAKAPQPGSEVHNGPNFALSSTRVNRRGRAMRAWIDRTNDGLSGMPADGISLPLKRGLRHVPLGGSKVRLHQPTTGRKGAWQLLAVRRSAAMSGHRSLVEVTGQDDRHFKPAGEVQKFRRVDWSRRAWQIRTLCAEIS